MGWVRKNITGADAAADAARAANKQVDNMADVANRQLDFSEELQEKFETKYGGLESNIIDDAMTGFDTDRDYGGDARVQNDVMRAGDDVRSAFRGLRAQQENDMVRHNIDPSSGRYAGSKRALGLSEAAQLAAAKSNTRQGSSRFYENQDYGRNADKFNKKLSAFSLGKGLPALASQNLAGAGQTYGGSGRLALGAGGLQVQAAGNMADFVGTAAGTGTGIWAASDRRVKRDLSLVGHLKSIPVYLFKYLWSDEQYMGVMAQDVEKVLPEAVTEVDGVKGVFYDKLLEWGEGEYVPCH